MPLSQISGKASTRGGLYAGAGGGYLRLKYDSRNGEIPAQTSFALSTIAGVNLFDMVDISYTFRTDFDNANNKVAVGYVYRFK